MGTIEREMGIGRERRLTYTMDAFSSLFLERKEEWKSFNEMTCSQKMSKSGGPPFPSFFKRLSREIQNDNNKVSKTDI